MILAKYLPLWICAMGASFAVPLSAEEMITWTRELATPAPQTSHLLTSGLVVVTRDSDAGPNAAQLAAELEQMRRAQQEQGALLAVETREKIEALRQVTRVELGRVEAAAQSAKDAAKSEAQLAAEKVRADVATQTLANQREMAVRLASAEKTAALAQASTETNRTLARTELALATEKLRAETATQTLAQQRATDARFAALEGMTHTNRLLAKTELLAMQQSLQDDASARLAAVEEATAQKLAAVAAQNQLNVTALQNATAHTLDALYATAKRDAEALTQSHATQVATQLAELNTRVAATDAKTLSVADVQALAAQTVTAAEPEFEALALNTLKNAEGYVRTVARQAVADKDPAMTKALGDAVASALAQEQSPAAFSMRRAIVNELANAVQGKISGTDISTRLGDDVGAIEPAAGEEVVDAARLRLGRLLNPGIVAADNPTQMATLTPNHDPRDSLISAGRARARTDLMDLRDYKVVLHADNQTLPAMLNQVIERAEPFAGPWQVRFRLKPENNDLLTERFSLDAETTFQEFVGYLAQYLVNDRGVKLTFSLFDRERVVLVSD